MSACGVIGEVTLASGATESVPPCTDDATETVRFRCANGHERERTVCETHALLLAEQSPSAPVFCVVCWETDGVEALLTMLGGDAR